MAESSPEFKVGDVVEVISKRVGLVGATLMHRGDCATVRAVRVSSANGMQVQVTGMGSLWLHHTHFRPTDRPVSTTPQPHLFANSHEARRGVTVDTRGADRVKVSANSSSSSAFTETRRANIFIEVVGGGSTGEGYTTLTVEEAKEVAVALFDQILYHEHMRQNEDV